MKSTKFLAAAVLVVASMSVLHAGVAQATTNAGVLSTMTVLADDLNDVTTAAGRQDLAALQSACHNLSADALVGLRQHRPKSMRRAAWTHLYAAYGYYSQAGSACYMGARNVDVAQLHRSTTLMDLATAETNKATAAL